MAKKTVFDGWANVLTGLGLAGRDKKLGATLEFTTLGQADAETLYAGSDVAEKVVKYPVQEALANGVIFTQKQPDELFQQTIEDYLERFNFMAKFAQAAEYGRLYGTGVLFFGIKGAANPSQPLDVTKSVGAITYIQVFHKHELEAGQIQTDIELPYYGLPISYKVKGTSIEIHRSRLVFIDGAKLTGELAKKNNFFGDSVLTKIQDKIRNYDTAHDAVATLIHDYSQGVYKLKGLAQLIASGKDKLVQERLALIDTKRSLVRSIVIDADGEAFERSTVSLAGVPEILEKMAERLTSASEMPHTVLLGEGAAGTLSGGGESENKQWKSYLAGYQTSRLKPALTESLKIMLSAGESPTNGIPEGFKSEFPSLYELNDLQAADVRLKNAQADEIYMRNQALDPDEVAISRFGSGTYGNEIKLNMAIRGTDVPTDNVGGETPEDNNAQMNEQNNGSKTDTITFEGGEWVLKSHSGKKIGSFKTKAEAKKRERQVKFFKRQTEDAIGSLTSLPWFQLPEHAKASALQVLTWKKEHPNEIAGLTSKVEKRAQSMSEKFFVDLDELEEIASFKKNLVNYVAGQAKPWEDPTTINVMSYGGIKTIEWAAELVGE